MPSFASSQQTAAAPRAADHSHREESDPPKAGEPPQWEFRSALMIGICVTRRLHPYCTPCSRYMS